MKFLLLKKLMLVLCYTLLTASSQNKNLQQLPAEINSLCIDAFFNYVDLRDPQRIISHFAELVCVLA